MDTAAPNAPDAGAPPQPSKVGAVVLALLINAVPLVGVLYFDWSAINVVVLYWFENLLIAICTSIRLLLHRFWTAEVLASQEARTRWVPPDLRDLP